MSLTYMNQVIRCFHLNNSLKQRAIARLCYHLQKNETFRARFHLKNPWGSRIGRTNMDLSFCKDPSPSTIQFDIRFIFLLHTS